MLWTVMNTLRNFCVDIFFSSLRYIDRSEIADSMLTLCLMFWGTVKLLFKIATPFYTPTSNPAMHKSSTFSTSLSTLIIVFLNYSLYWSACVAITECQRLGSFIKKEVYLALGSAGWEVQGHGLGFWWGVLYCLILQKAKGEVDMCEEGLERGNLTL